MELLKRICFSILLFPIVFIAIGLLFVLTGYSDYQDYKTAYDTTAIVTKCKGDVDTTGDTADWHYDIYISYTFDGKEHSDIYWKSQNNAIDIGETVSVKVSSRIPEKPFSENPLSLSIWGVPFVLFGIIFSFKVIPSSFSGKENFVSSAQIPNKSKKTLWFLLVPVVASIVFLILGLNFNTLFHIGTIIFTYFVVVLLEILF